MRKRCLLLQHLVILLPREPGSVSLVIALVGLIIGLSLWIAGARFSQSILTLAAVAMGTWLGMRLPVWRHWDVDPMAPAVAGAMVLGISAYMLHKIWVGIWLGVLLGVWATLVLWATRGSQFHWKWPVYEGGQTLPQYLGNLWQNVPDAMQQCLGFTAAAAMLVGISAALLWPRVGISLLWSAAGVSLLIPAVMTGLTKIDPQILREIPRQTSDQLAVLLGLVGLGAIFQWRMNGAPAAAGAGESKSPKKEKPSGPD